MILNVFLVLSTFLLKNVRSQGIGNGIAKTTYSGSQALVGLDFNLKYFPVHESDDSCADNVCECVLDGKTYLVEQGRSQLNVDSSSFLDTMPKDPMLDGFGLHLVNCSTNTQPGGMTTQQVEAEFATKLGDMTAYDSFMDYNAALLTTDLDSYVTAFDADGVNYLPITWEDQDQAYYGVMVLVPESQMVLEVMAYNSTLTSKLANHPKLLKMNEVRHPASSIERARARLEAMRSNKKKPTNAQTDIFTAITVGRAATDLDALDNFYIGGMENTVTLSYNDVNGVSKRCYLWTPANATVDVCFTVRSDDATAGDFKVSDFQDMLNTVHQNIIDGQEAAGGCNNKWADNHYAVDATDSSSTHDYVVDYIERTSGVFYYCGQSTLHYIIDPTGWGIQLDFEFTDSSVCDGSARKLTHDEMGPPPPDDDHHGPPPGDDDHNGPPPGDDDHNGPPPGDDDGSFCPCTTMTSCYAS